MLFVPIFLSIVAVAVTAVSVYYIVRIVRQQLKLYYSIQLVILKTRRAQYLIAASLFLLFTILCFILTFDTKNFVFVFCAANYGLDTAMVKLILIMLTVMLFALCILNVVMLFAKSAIMDRGIHTPNRFIDWHRLYYYLVDEEKNNLIFSVNKKGPYTLLETFGAFTFSAADIEKIKFILNKNKNKFLKHYDVR